MSRTHGKQFTWSEEPRPTQRPDDKPPHPEPALDAQAAREGRGARRLALLAVAVMILVQLGWEYWPTYRDAVTAAALILLLAMIVPACFTRGTDDGA